MKHARIGFGILLLLATLAAIALVTTPAITEKFTQADDYSGTVMFFRSEEGVEKAAITITGPAGAISAYGKAMLPELKMDGNTQFLAVVETETAQKIREEIRLKFLATEGGRTRTRTLPIDRVTTIEATNIRREENSVVLETQATPIPPDTRVLIWTTVRDTKVTVNGQEPKEWLARRIGTGGYWVFDFPGGITGGIDFKVTPPSLLEGEPVEDVVETILTKVEDFQLVILPPKGHASVTNVRVSIAQAAAAAADAPIEEEAKELLESNSG